MRYFIKSAGSARNRGYRYYEIQPKTEELKVSSETEVEHKDNPEFKGLLDSLHFHLALFNCNGFYRLVIGYLESDNRKDFDSRKIHNSFVFHATDKETENGKLQQLAASVLENQTEFCKKIDAAVRPNKDNGFGFSIDWKHFEQILSEYWQYEPKLCRELTRQEPLKASLESKEKLAEYLRECSLPNTEGALIVVGYFADANKFTKLQNVCRGLFENDSLNFDVVKEKTIEELTQQPDEEKKSEQNDPEYTQMNFGRVSDLELQQSSFFSIPSPVKKMYEKIPLNVRKPLENAYEKIPLEPETKAVTLAAAVTVISPALDGGISIVGQALLGLAASVGVELSTKKAPSQS